MDIDEAYNKVVGEYGPYQKRVFWALSVSQAYLAFHQIHNVYMAAEPVFHCVTEKGQFEGCGTKESVCQHYNFNSSSFSSIVTEWDLVCGDAYKASMIQSAFMAGLMIGSMVFGTIADRFGRRKVLFTLPTIALLTLIGGFSVNYTMYIICRHVAGIFVGGWLVVSFVLTTEVIGSSQRGFLAMIIPCLFAIGIVVYSLLAYLIPYWRWLTLTTALPGFLGIVFYWTIPESPRWLYSQGRIQDAQTLLEDFYRKNYGSRVDFPIKLKNTSKPEPSKEQGDNTSMTVILRHPIIRKRTAINIYTWFVNCAVYYGLTFAASSLGGNMYISVSFSGIVEIPAYLVTWYLIEKLGRRYTFSGSMLVGGVFCVGILLLPTANPYTKNVLALAGKICISVSFCVAWIYTAEMYPTTIRNKCMSVCNFSARLGGVVSPMILTLGKAHPNYEFVVFGLMTFVAGMISVWLPETANQPMPETVEDITDQHSVAEYRILKQKDSFQEGDEMHA